MLESRVRTEGGMLTGEILGWRYTGSYEEGSQPARQGNGSQKQQMLSQLREWARVRGMTAGMSESEQQSLAYALRKKILREGTSLYRSGGRRDIITPALERLQKDMETKVTDAYMGILTQQIDEQIFRR